jgi:hypothetical protein
MANYLLIRKTSVQGWILFAIRLQDTNLIIGNLSTQALIRETILLESASTQRMKERVCTFRLRNDCVSGSWFLFNMSGSAKSRIWGKAHRCLLFSQAMHLGLLRCSFAMSRKRCNSLSGSFRVIYSVVG